MTRWIKEGSKQGAIAKVSRRSQLIKWAFRMDLILIGRNGLRIKTSGRIDIISNRNN